MFEEKDYYMRIVHELVRMLIRLVFSKDIDRDGEEAVPLEVLEKYKKLISMIDDGQINEAENLLLDGLEPDSRAYFELALMFYEKLNGKTDEFLEEHDYSREEVTDGIKYVVDFYGYGSLMDAFVDENALG
ncbi:MAG TPA: hypothetical protein H9911_05455 [Candidatus Mediterraneibacter tabaqchaliae]|uniref:Uncharacterized protein n=1 Tax=Candidatus Mediterraneibacter tabaqchaliae TaxID=2838689 RepID=A0A9D2U329_9FIRM|nr:hypothetical protein [Candidatus Mediterraneibacter tabaqchaliae]